MFAKNLKRNLAVLGALVVASVPAMAQAVVDTEISGGIADGIAQILAIVALGGAGYIGISSAGVAWTVGAKFIKRLGSKS